MHSEPWGHVGQVRLKSLTQVLIDLVWGGNSGRVKHWLVFRVLRPWLTKESNVDLLEGVGTAELTGRGEGRGEG